MKLTLIRTYHPKGTNGTLYTNGEKVCHTIELPWKENLPQRSCIPEGRYELQWRWSARFKHHLLVTGVPNRSLILVHPANDAQQELRGCIAPVTFLTAPGRGSCSHLAFTKLLRLVEQASDEEPILLFIKAQYPMLKKSKNQ